MNTAASYADVTSAWVTIITVHRLEVASLHLVTFVDGAWVIVIAYHTSVETTSIGSTRISGASISVVTVERSVKASLGSACVDGAFIAIVA
jgi:hypothetical protein